MKTRWIKSGVVSCSSRGTSIRRVDPIRPCWNPNRSSPPLPRRISRFRNAKASSNRKAASRRRARAIGSTGCWEAMRLSGMAVMMIAWLVGVVLLLVRLVRPASISGPASPGVPFDESRLPIQWPELCRLAGVAETIRIVEHDALAAPAVWGMARPTILFPQGLVSSLSRAITVGLAS